MKRVYFLIIGLPPTIRADVMPAPVPTLAEIKAHIIIVDIKKYFWQ